MNARAPWLKIAVLVLLGAATPAPPPALLPTPPSALPADAEDAPEATDDPVLPIPPIPPRIASGAQYETCLAMLPTDPSGADSYAVAWAQSDGGEAAAHCHGLAQIELGNTEAGAAILDQLAATSAAPAPSRAAVYAQADQAWTMSGHADRALASADAAVTLAPENPDLRIDRGRAALALGHALAAIDDLGIALDADPKRGDAWLARASAWRQLGKLEAAQDDLERCFALDPDDPGALLERGIVRQRLGDLDGARNDWKRAAELAEDTATGDLAQQDLALLEAGSRK